MTKRVLANTGGGRPWLGRLWYLAAALAAATVVLIASIVHDSNRLRATARAMAQSAAEQVASLVNGRVEVLALETFAPVTPWSSRSPVTASGAVEALLAAQRDAERCRCRDTLPVSAFFRFDVGRGAIDLRETGNSGARALPSADALVTVVRAEAARLRAHRQSSVHLIAGPPLTEQAVVTVVQFTDSGEPVAVYGAIGDSRQMFATLFEHERPSGPVLHATAGLTRLDTLSVQVATANGTPVFGVIGDDHQYRGSVAPHGPLDGLTVTGGLTTVQIPMRLFVSRAELSHLMILITCTVLVIAFAVGSSRRELLLARARSDFIAGVSHDLRMPLAQILIASETLALQRERNEAERATLASSIVREARRLIGLVDNVMLFSRSGAVALRPRLELVPLDALFASVVEAVQLAVDDAQQTVQIAAPTDLAVSADRQLIRQALVNLIDNALKYGASGQSIRLSGERHDASAVRLYVDDEGPGIPEAERSRVFQPYERLSRDQTSERTGAGLGLSVVQQIAVACNGRVWLESRVAGGTRAVLELPAAAPIRASTRAPELV